MGNTLAFVHNWLRNEMRIEVNQARSELLGHYFAIIFSFISHLRSIAVEITLPATSLQRVTESILWVFTSVICIVAYF